MHCPEDVRNPEVKQARLNILPAKMKEISVEKYTALPLGFNSTDAMDKAELKSKNYS